MIRTQALFVLLSALPVPLFAADEGDDFVKSALRREIIGPRQTLAEVRDFTKSRVPKMPEVKSAEEWTKTAERLRSETLAKVIFRGEAAAWRDAKCRVEWLEVLEGGPGYAIRKLRYEVLPGLWIPALLYEPTKLEGKAPVILNVNGHDPKGKAADYKQIRCINLAKRGMIALNVEWFGMGQFRTPGFNHPLINLIDLCGTSGIATHFLSMKRGLDVLLAHEHADPKRVAVTGLSGGGWQTIFISPLDPRVTLTNPVAGYSSYVTRIENFSDLGDSEQTPCDLATVVDYAHLTAMMAPHPTLLTFNAKDNCCFAAGHALPPLMEAAGPVFELFGRKENLRSHVNEDPGDHNYGLDNRQTFYRMVGDNFYAGDSGYDPKEIPSEKEVKTPEQLQVSLPSDNRDLHHLALDLAKSLPRNADLPTSRAEAETWQSTGRSRLHAIVRPYESEIAAEKVGEDERDGVRARYWKLRLGTTWTVPAVELSKGEGKKTALLIADAGRKESAGNAKALLDDGKRVIAIDLFYFGEAKVAERDYLFALMVGTVGERPLGLQAGQLASVAKWAATEGRARPEIVAIGPRTSMIALVAAALEEKAIDGLVMREPLGSLKELIEQRKDFAQSPELCCFGLLEYFDVKQIAALVAPRHVMVKLPSDRARRELDTLKSWYGLFGADFDPLR